MCVSGNKIIGNVRATLTSRFQLSVFPLYLRIQYTAMTRHFKSYISVCDVSRQAYITRNKLLPSIFISDKN